MRCSTSTFPAYALPFKSRDPIVSLAWHCNDLYGVEIFPYDNQWSTDSDGEVLRIVP